MIRIGDKYMISADDRQYVLNDILVAGPNTKSPGKEYYRPFSYERTLTRALEVVSKRMQRDVVADPAEMSLSEAIRRMRDVENKIGRMIEGRTGGI